MVAKSHSRGHSIIFEDEQWIFEDTGNITEKERSCKKCGKDYEEVLVKISSELSYTGATRWKKAKVDKCVAPIVRALQEAGIDMRGSCCGHGNYDGEILLSDGRSLLIKREVKEEDVET